MPKAKPPASLRRVPVISELALTDDFCCVEAFKLSDDSREALSTVLELSGLPPLVASTLELAISRYRAQSRLPFVTAKQNIAAIDVSLSAAAAFEASLHCFADLAHSGVGGKTATALHPLACGALLSLRKFCAVAHSRKEELDALGRLGYEHGPLGGLCSLTKFVFEATGCAPKNLHAFVLAVLEAAKISWKDYFDHKSRLEKLFSMELQDDHLARRLREECLHSRSKKRTFGGLSST